MAMNPQDQSQMMQQQQGQPQPPRDGNGQQPDGQPQQSGPQELDIDEEQVTLLLFSRLRDLNPQEAQIFADMITPETVHVLLKIVPELTPLFEQVIQGKMARQAGPGMPGGQPQMPPPGAQQQMPQPPQQAGNPAMMGEQASRGLMG